MDICQSVLASFFVRAAVGQYDLNQPEDLLRLLVRMARNKVISQARRQRARAADHQRAETDNLEGLSGGDRTPDSVVAGRDLLAQVQQRLDDEERRVAVLRGEGRSWPEIAAELGGTPEGRRKQLTRALDRVAQELGLEEQSQEA